MFIQPDVRVDNGVTMKLDHALGDWITILGWQADPTSALAPGQLDQLLRMGITFFKIVGSCPSAQGRSVSFAETLVVEDCDNHLRQWFESRNVDYVVLRPDRYVATAATQSEFARQVERLVDLANAESPPLAASSSRRQTP
jgi:3-(3-hydroxy-phenyl)propionate hydroxylase